MRSPYTTQSSTKDPLWNFLAEFSLSEFLSYKETGDALKAELQRQVVQDLGIPAECLKKIETTLLEFLEQTKMHFNQGKKVFPIVIRLFYGKNMFHPINTKTFGGWGFFIIKRAQDFRTGSAEDSPNFIDLFLYKEGE